VADAPQPHPRGESRQSAQQRQTRQSAPQDAPATPPFRRLAAALPPLPAHRRGSLAARPALVPTRRPPDCAGRARPVSCASTAAAGARLPFPPFAPALAVFTSGDVHASQPHEDQRHRTLPPLRHLRHRSRARTPTPTRARSSSWCCSTASWRSSSRWASPTRPATSTGYVLATVPGDQQEAGGAGDRLHRARRHLAGVERRRRQAGRAPQLAGAGHRCCPTTRRRCLRRSGEPDLEEQIGNDIITASGKTLLGADNKAGVAAVMRRRRVPAGCQHPVDPARRRCASPSPPTRRWGAGTKHFDVQKFGAYCAYTMDGERLGQIDAETFSADALTVTLPGLQHPPPGFAKGQE